MQQMVEYHFKYISIIYWKSIKYTALSPKLLFINKYIIFSIYFTFFKSSQFKYSFCYALKLNQIFFTITSMQQRVKYIILDPFQFFFEKL